VSEFMRWRVRASRTRLRAPLVWVRHFGLDASDVFLASYPRSGNTMLRFPLAELIGGIPASFDHVQRIVPEIGVHVDAFPLLPGTGRLIKTHERYRRQYRRAIYIVRDVRDIALSAFARESALGLLGGMSFDEYLEPFLLGRMSRWGAWSDHVESWLVSPIARNSNLLLMRYEDIHCGVAEAVSSALNFIGVRATENEIRRACEGNSISEMRAKERQSATLPRTAEGGGLVRTGIAEGWRQTFTGAQLALVERYAGKMLTRFGYEKPGGREPRP